MKIDTTMPIELCSAPKIFTALADAVEWVLREQGLWFVIHYLNNFLLVGKTAYAAGATQLRIVLDTFKELELPVTMKKLEGPLHV